MAYRLNTSATNIFFCMFVLGSFVIHKSNYMALDMGHTGGGDIISKFQVPSFYGLGQKGQKGPLKSVYMRIRKHREITNTIFKVWKE